jgi:hypothetical protein
VLDFVQTACQISVRTSTSAMPIVLSSFCCFYLRYSTTMNSKISVVCMFIVLYSTCVYGIKSVEPQVGAVIVDASSANLKGNINTNETFRLTKPGSEAAAHVELSADGDILVDGYQSTHNYGNAYPWVSCMAFLFCFSIHAFTNHRRTRTFFFFFFLFSLFALLWFNSLIFLFLFLFYFFWCIHFIYFMKCMYVSLS